MGSDQVGGASGATGAVGPVDAVGAVGGNGQSINNITPRKPDAQKKPSESAVRFTRWAKDLINFGEGIRNTFKWIGTGITTFAYIFTGAVILDAILKEVFDVEPFFRPYVFLGVQAFPAVIAIIPKIILTPIAYALDRGLGTGEIPNKDFKRSINPWTD